MFTIGQHVRFAGHAATIVHVDAKCVDVAWQGRTGVVRERVTPSGYKRIKEA